MTIFGLRGAAGVLSLALLGTACAQGEVGEDDTLTLRVGTGVSNQNLYWSAGVVPWMESVTEKTDGRVQFETYTSGELVDVTEEFDALNSGTLDIALLLPVYQPDQFPLAEVTMLPTGETDTTIGSSAWKALMDSDAELQDGKTFYDLQFADQGLKAFPVHTTQEFTVSTTGQEFDSVNSTQSLQLRTASRVHDIYAENLGINTISIPNAETFDALSRGAFDGAFTSVADWGNYGLQDLYTYTVTGINFGHFNGTISMTESTWSSFPDDVQEAMEDALEETYAGGAEAWLEQAEEIRTHNETEAGGEFVDISDLPPEVEGVLEDGVEETWIDWIEAMESQGTPGEEAALLWRDLFTAEGGEVPSAISEIE